MNTCGKKLATAESDGVTHVLPFRGVRLLVCSVICLLLLLLLLMVMVMVMRTHDQYFVVCCSYCITCVVVVLTFWGADFAGNLFVSGTGAGAHRERYR